MNKNHEFLCTQGKKAWCIFSQFLAETKSFWSQRPVTWDLLGEIQFGRYTFWKKNVRNHNESHDFISIEFDGCFKKDILLRSRTLFGKNVGT